jgi:phospholipase/lecithinase/hemolysin
MGLNSLPLALTFLLLSFSLSSAHNKTKTINYKGCFSKVYAFGDSFTDTGNAQSLGGLMAFSGVSQPGSPYGSTFFNQPTSRLCDGRLLIDFLSETLSLPYLPPYKHTSANFSHGVNFAIAGSTVFRSHFYEKNHVGRTLFWKSVPECTQTQVDWFHKYMQDVECKGKDMSACKSKMEQGLFWIGSMGMHDYSRNFGSAVSVQSLMETLVSQKCKLLKALLIKGAKYIVVQGLPPMGCFPLHMSLSPWFDRDEMGCSKSFNSIIKAHNELLERKLAEIRLQYSSCHILYADFWGAYLSIMKKPEIFGFAETYKACCGAGDGKLNFHLHSLCGSAGASKCENPSKFISWDGVHLTEAMHATLANLFFHQGFCRPSFSEMIRAKLGSSTVTSV